MGRGLQSSALVVALWLACAPAHAADAPPPVKDWSKDIETVVVTAHRSGPLMWKVKKGDATVVLFGILEPVPEKLAWDDAPLRDALKGARQMLLPPQASVGLVEGLWFLAWNSDKVYLPSDTPMEATLPASLRARFVAGREKIHRDADRYSSLRLPLAGLRYEGDFFKERGLVYDEPLAALKHIAHSLGVPVKTIADYEAIPMLKQLPSMPASANEMCLTASLDDVEALGVHAVPAAQAWAKGNLAGIEANYSERRFESCIQAVPSFEGLFKRAVNDSMNALNASLEKPGTTVMVVSLGELLRDNGLLDKLGAESLSVEQY
jgi:TraB/PrgY/gumN family